MRGRGARVRLRGRPWRVGPPGAAQAGHERCPRRREVWRACRTTPRPPRRTRRRGRGSVVVERTATGPRAERYGAAGGQRRGGRLGAQPASRALRAGVPRAYRPRGGRGRRSGDVRHGAHPSGEGGRRVAGPHTAVPAAARRRGHEGPGEPRDGGYGAGRRRGVVARRGGQRDGAAHGAQQGTGRYARTRQRWTGPPGCRPMGRAAATSRTSAPGRGRLSLPSPHSPSPGSRFCTWPGPSDRYVTGADRLLRGGERGQCGAGPCWQWGHQYVGRARLPSPCSATRTDVPQRRQGRGARP